MKDLNYYKEIIKEKRKKTHFKDYLMEITSWATFTFHRNNGFISKFPETERIKKIIHWKDFEETRDGLLLKGVDYNFNKSFFKNFQKLFLSMDIFNAISYGGTEDSDYSDMVLDSKTCYLSSGVINGCENILYSFSIKDNCTNTLNSLSVYQNSENIYSSSGILSSFNVFFSRFINNSNNIWFSSNLNGCSECILCSDLENCSYYIKNKKYTKEEYKNEKKNLLKNKNEFENLFSNVERIGKNINSTHVNGVSFFNSENIKNGYYGYNVKNGRNLMLVGGVNGDEEMYDCFTAGSPTSDNFYAVMGANGDNLYCSMNITMSSNCYYSYKLNECSYCLGCIGLVNKSYCILNKQYSKEEWTKLSVKIFSQMENEGCLGDFFPGELNPFYFNDTIAGLIGGFSKHEVQKEGYMWRDKEIKVDIPHGFQTVEVNELERFEGFDTNGNWKINKEILSKIIVDEKGNYYRIVQMEYDFLVKYGLPLPRHHWFGRMKLNFGM